MPPEGNTHLARLLPGRNPWYGRCVTNLRRLIVSAVEAIGGEPPETLDPLVAFVELVQVWNARSNLTGARTPEALVDVLLVDALALADEALVPSDARFVDVGAGAGSPSIPLCLLRPDLSATLVEPRRKRVAFMRTAVGALDLVDRVRVEERRLEGPPLPGAPFDVALSRATFEPAEWLARGRDLAPRVLVLTGAEPLPDPDALQRRRDYALPTAGTPRAIGVY